MKHILLAGLILIFASTFVFAVETIVKVAPNNVEVQTIYYQDTKGLQPITIKTKSYGQLTIDRELKSAQAELAIANAINCLTYKPGQIKLAQDKIDELEIKIQGEMNK